MKKRILIIFALLTVLNIYAQKEKHLASTPPMGWNSWNMFEGDINEKIVREIADAFVKTGLKDAGYEYIIIDDKWQGGRDTMGNLIPDPEKFPSGMKALADYVHSKGLKFGIYSDAAEKTCAGYTGSYGYEDKDAATFANWGVDYLKYDYCYAPAKKKVAVKRYSTMSKALQNTGRDIVFAICEWGKLKPWKWGRRAGGNLWRTTWDSRDIWESKNYSVTTAGILEILDKQNGLEKYTRPGGWNDPDMLMVGLYGKGKSSGKKGCTDTEYKSHFALWCMLAAPLIANLDVRNMNEPSKNILLNKDMIAIDQDSLGKQAVRIIDNNGINIYLKKLSGGEWAILFLNRNNNTVNITFDWKKLRLDDKISAKGYKSLTGYNLYDIWKHKKAGNTNKPLKTAIKSHDVLVLKLIK